MAEFNSEFQIAFLNFLLVNRLNEVPLVIMHLLAAVNADSIYHFSTKIECEKTANSENRQEFVCMY